MAFELPKLDYPYDALEPHIDARTMEIHHSKHHAGYTNKLNNAINGTNLEGQGIEDLLGKTSSLPTAVRNNGGGYYNHNLFWKNLAPNGGGNPSGALADAIDKAFGSFEKFREEFTNASLGRFGSGWAWLIQKGSELAITSTPNQDNPLMDIADERGTILLGIDVWEHAYYLKYQNRRAEYVEAFWNVVNWDEVSARYSG